MTKYNLTNQCLKYFEIKYNVNTIYKTKNNIGKKLFCTDLKYKYL